MFDSKWLKLEKFSFSIVWSRSLLLFLDVKIETSTVNTFDFKTI